LSYPLTQPRLIVPLPASVPSRPRKGIRFSEALHVSVDGHEVEMNTVASRARLLNLTPENPIEEKETADEILGSVFPGDAGVCDGKSFAGRDNAGLRHRGGRKRSVWNSRRTQT